MSGADDLTMKEAVDQIYYGANCRDCQEVRRVDLSQMLQIIGPYALVRDLRPRLRCRKCGGKQIVVTTLWKNSTVAVDMMKHWVE